MSGPTPFVQAFKGLPVNTIRYQTSQQGLPIAIIYGTTRVPPNLLEYFNYVAPPNGKKGGGSGKKNGTYSVDVAFGFGQGPLPYAFTGKGGSNDTWANGGQVPWSGADLSGYTGADGQPPDAVFQTIDPNTPVLGYSGMVTATGTPMQLGQSPAIPSFSAEISGFFYGTAGPDQPWDASLPLIIADLFSNARYGAGFPAAALDTAGTFADAQNYCQANQLGMSALLDRQRPASDWAKSWLELASLAAVWSGAVLKLIPYATGPVSGNGTSWSPSTLTPIYALDDDDFLPWEGNSRDNSSAEPGNGPSDPVQVTVGDPRTPKDWVSFEYWDSSNAYNANVAPAFDQGALDLYGPRPEVSKEAHCFTNAASAGAAANIYLARQQAVRRTFKFKLGWKYVLLEPMDVVSLTDPYIGLAALPVRITSVEEDDNGELTVEAEELSNVAAGAPPLYPTQAPSNQPLGLYASPGNANAPVIFEPPPALSNGIPMLAIGSSGGANWGGARVWLSFDGATYKSFGAISTGLAQGVLTANLASYGGSNPDTADTLSVDLTMSGGTLTGTTLAQAEAGVNWSYCGGELVGFETATLIAANKYNLTNLIRGFAGSASAAHSTGAPFALIGLGANPGVFSYPYPAQLIGQTIYVKLTSFNLFGNMEQELSAVTAHSYALTGAGAVSPSSVQIDYPGAIANGDVALFFTAGETIHFPANFAGSTVSCGTPATVTTPFDVVHNGTVIGTMTLAASATTATFSGIAAFTLSLSDTLSLVAQRSDATLANLTGVLIGSN